MRYCVAHLDEIAPVGVEPRSGIRDWVPVRAELGIKSFGVNAFVAREAGDLLIEEHDERVSGHEELYLVFSGEARFTIEGQEVPAQTGSLIFVRDPAVRRRATALSGGTTLLAVGGTPGKPFETTHWETGTRSTYGRRSS